MNPILHRVFLAFLTEDKCVIYQMIQTSVQVKGKLTSYDEEDARGGRRRSSSNRRRTSRMRMRRMVSKHIVSF